ncbi:MAG: hypothetical protein QW751_01500 [Candidatus Aenigmatarchaeota archaeon]|nr:hypothetical protein [Candidatus Aenigmarchaeota archaeon]
MPKTRRTPFKLEAGTGWFLAILLISAAAALWNFDMALTVLMLGICGAAVAILNIRVEEERDLLIGVTALTVILFAMTSITELATLSAPAKAFFINLLVAFGITGFIVALSLIAKVGLRK